MNDNTAEKRLNALKSYRKNVEGVDRLYYKTVELGTIAQGLTSPMLSDMPAGGSTAHDKDTRILEHLHALDQYQRARERQRRARHAILCDLRKLKNARYARLLYFRYIKGYKWDRIAHALHVSPSHVYKIHRDALQAYAHIDQ